MEGKFADLSNVKRFNCTAFSAVPAERRQKLDDKTKKLIFVGHEVGKKGYRLLDTQTDKITVSHAVFFIKGDPHNNSMQRSIEENEQASDQEIYCEIVLDDSTHTTTQQISPQPTTLGQEVRRSASGNKGTPPERLIETINKVTTVLHEPRSFQEAVNSDDAEHWSQAIDEEIKCLKSNKSGH